MRGGLAVVAVAASAVIATASPGRSVERRDEVLRLIKTSEADPGTWMTEAEKIANFGTKRGGWLDVTSASPEVLALMSSNASHSVRRTATAFPTELSHNEEAEKYISKVQTCGTKQWMRNLTDFYTRDYQTELGVQSGQWLLETVSYFAGRNPNAVVTTMKHDGFDQETIIATYPGESPALVVVGAHYDSTTVSPSGRAPGADDNGSGVVVILEALRVLAKYGFKPKNTLEFHFYAGEEGGELGSFDLWSRYNEEGKSVVAFVNQDMAGYSPSHAVSVFTDYADPGLVAYAQLIARVYTGTEPTSDICGYGCSDHYPAYLYGFPVVYVCDEPIATSSPYYHTEEDAYDTIMWDAIERHAIFTTGFLIEASYL
ncbi:Peptide hydrolase [Pleurostoma richardsiae]|uniref:Peptide hydrolase n=1 Tax=Pleurostoma richardsiae TaxID=41990 RepID=A0AA38RQQ4_9PEZI|nr:Peptide hydrolase [Pleurostoma richardsiae]